MPRKRNVVGQLITDAFKRHGAPFVKRLSAHTSCVNALSWSGDGRWFASAGDDRKIALWDFHPLDDMSSPVVSAGPRGNVLCLAFSATNSYVFSGGLDEEILQYDISRMSSTVSAASPIVRRYSQHDASIRAISPHPQADHVLLSASDDGLVILHDARVPQDDGVPSLSLNVEVTGVQYHPTMEHIFVTSDGAGNCHLRDARTAFRCGNHGSKGLLKYVTTLSEPGSLRMSSPEVSSVVFDSTGTKLAVTMLNYLPTIFNVWDEWPLATCSGAGLLSNSAAHNLNDERFYVNACTIKQGSFGPPGLRGHSFYGAGSDDFRGYVWDIPNLEQLAACRTELGHAQWAAESLGGSTGFAKSATRQRVVPVEIREPQFMLYGHESIVNTLMFHPVEPYIATSGVERHVLVHSPFEATATFGKLDRTENKVRRLPERGARHSYFSFESSTGEDDDDDEHIIAHFDEILRQEGSANIWETRKWSGDNSDSYSSSHSSFDSDTDAESDTGSTWDLRQDSERWH